MEEAARTGRDPYDLMNERAEQVPPGSYGMLCCFSDLMNFITWKHASPTLPTSSLSRKNSTSIPSTARFLKIQPCW